VSFEVRRAAAGELVPALRLLEEGLRGGRPLPEGFVDGLRREVAAGRLEVLLALSGEEAAGVLALAYRPSLASGEVFASIEDLYVRPQERSRGAGSSLLAAAEDRCRERGLSYLEVQADGRAAQRFYAARGFEPETGIRVMSRSLPLAPAPRRRRPP
jgi:GNAT superfamily N-acetyltransferase